MRACLICSTQYATSTPGCAARCANTIKEGTARREADEEGNTSHFQMPIITYFAQTRQEHQTCSPNLSGQELPKKNWSYSQVSENAYMFQNVFKKPHFSPILENMFNCFWHDCETHFTCCIPKFLSLDHFDLFAIILKVDCFRNTQRAIVSVGRETKMPTAPQRVHASINACAQHIFRHKCIEAHGFVSLL